MSVIFHAYSKVCWLIPDEEKRAPYVYPLMKEFDPPNPWCSATPFAVGCIGRPRRAARSCLTPGLWYQAQLVYDEGKMSVASPVYFEIVDFIAAGTTPETVIDFRPSPEAQQRVAALIEREKAGTLSQEEEAELDHFLELEHILRMAKARARQILSRGE